ncbi:MAG: hypothetical protein ACOYBQ_07560 [Fluviibacter sp.]
MLFAVVALRGVIELVLWLLIGRAVLALLAGRQAMGNGVLRVFDFLLSPLRQFAQRCAPACAPGMRDLLLFMALFAAWLALAFVKAGLHS